MKRIFLLLVLSGATVVAQEPGPSAQTQAPAANGTAPLSPGQTMGAPVPDTNAPPTATQTSGLLSPPPDNPPAISTTPPPARLTPVPAVTTPPVTTPATATGTHSVTRSEIVRIDREEIVRRQDMIYRADQAMIQARKDEVGQRYPDSRKNYLFAAAAYGSVSHTSSRYRTAAAGLERVDLALYADALKYGDTARAKMLIDETVQYNPDDQVALEKQRETNDAIQNPNDTHLLGNPAVTPAFVGKLNETQQLFIEAEQFRRTGQYDEAETRLKRILGIDPYNMAATRLLEHIVAEKTDYAEHARIENREEMLRQVQEEWYEPINNKSTNIAAQEAQAPISRTTNFDLDQKLRSIFIPTLDFTNASVEEATSFLFNESKRLDEPTHKGIPFIIQPDASSAAKPITLTLNNVPVGEALRYICQLANVKYKVQDYAVSIVPFSASTEDLISRVFIVPPSFVTPSEAPSTDTSAVSNPNLRVVTPIARAGVAATSDSTQSVLESKGVKFPGGASAVYTPSTNTLTVVDTADQMELIEELVNGAQAPTLMVRIATKFVEINQNDLNDLTFNYSFNLPPAITTGLSALTNGVVHGPGVFTSLPGAAGFAPDSIDQLIVPQTNVENTLQISGAISGMQYSAIVNALSQKRSFDLLSEPTALGKSGEQAIMEAVRVFPYPVAFDPPELVTQTNSSSGTGATTVTTSTPPTVIATTPTDFKRRNIGVRLVIKPQVTADNKTVDLSLFPEVTDFEGFINYGSEIFIGNPDGTTSLLTPNDINQPVFNTRRINTKVLIHDGSTVVLGGLIREDIQTINDKVPILGDIPLLGRLFQSKATESNKRNLIIFVTANIYQNDGELLNPPEVVNAADVLTGHAAYSAPATQ